MMSAKLSDISISNIISADYHCIIIRISKSEALHLMHNIGVTKKSGIF